MAVSVENTQLIACPAPSRRQEDHQIVEVFLHAYDQGRFAHSPNWLPQDQSNVEVIAASGDGMATLAIEHARLFEAFDGRLANPDEDPELATIGTWLTDLQLPVSDRAFIVDVCSKSLRKLIKKHPSVVRQEMTKWAQRELPKLYDHREFTIPIPVKLPKDSTPAVRVGVQVWPIRTNMPIVVGGYLPPFSELVARVRKAFGDKLPKLTRTQASLRFLMLEPVTLASDSEIARTVCEVATEFPLISQIDAIVFASTSRFHLDGAVFFRCWHPKSKEWADIIAAKVDISSRPELRWS